MTKIAFKVSARTAKLIGQENFSNPEGATIELVKNCYDADAKNCLVVYDILFDNIPETLSAKDFKSYAQENEAVRASYKLKNGKYLLTQSSNEERTNGLQSFFFSFNSIYIIDNGDGMTQFIIQNQWMEIGTGNKETNYISDDGRIKTGAKGIGRFALDRLGFFTEMWTVPKEKKSGHGFYWSMDWKQFDTPNKSVSDIEADFEPKDLNIKTFLEANFKSHSVLLDFVKSKPFSSGTIIKISKLKDSWNETNLQSVFKSLEALIPPKELAIPFNVNFYQLQKPKAFGEVETAYFNDYDYKVFAKYNSKNLSVDLTVTRNELDLKKVKKEFAYIFKNAKQPYDLNTIEKKEFKISKTANEILKWENNNYNESALKKLGDINFSFYFLQTQKSQKEKYPFKDINQKEREKIIDRFGGIKIYRDSFRVRPYGEVGNDWLKLGERAAVSPAGAGQRIGDWRVRPYQVAGLVTISRIENPNLLDKSDRGGLQENETFGTLQKLLKALIYEFELDRSKILNPFYLDGKKKEDIAREVEIRKEAEKLADKIVLERQKVEHKIYGSKQDLFKSKKDKEEREAYQRVITKSLEKFEKGDGEDAEIAQIRTLASLGLIVSSFSHELKDARNNFADIVELEKTFNKIIPDEKRKGVDFKDGINSIERLKLANEKIVHWVDYSLTAIKKDKRKREKIKFDKYFLGLNKNWKTALKNGHIELEIINNLKKQYIFRAFEMDMNTIFNNLLSNSIEAFHNLKVIRDRKIVIGLSIVKNHIQIIYSDNGTGISSVFKRDKDEIFLPFVTSKKEGTGLGMYLVKNVVNDNNGSVEIMVAPIGFKLKIDFPIRKK